MKVKMSELNAKYPDMAAVNGIHYEITEGTFLSLRPTEDADTYIIAAYTIQGNSIATIDGIKIGDKAELFSDTYANASQLAPNQQAIYVYDNETHDLEAYDQMQTSLLSDTEALEAFRAGLCMGIAQGETVIESLNYGDYNALYYAQ